LKKYRKYNNVESSVSAALYSTDLILATGLYFVVELIRVSLTGRNVAIGL